MPKRVTGDMFTPALVERNVYCVPTGDVRTMVVIEKGDSGGWAHPKRPVIETYASVEHKCR